MSERFQKKSAGFFVTIFIGLIVISFIFTGYQSLDGGRGAAATVNGHEISERDFKLAHGSTLEFYRKMLGGRDLNLKQRERLNLRKNVINNLIKGKLLFFAAQDIGLTPGPEEISASIKSLPQFTTDNKFDIGKYKFLLKSKGMAPKDFEKRLSEELALGKIQQLFIGHPVSSGHVKAVEKFRGQQLDAHLVKIDRQKLLRFISVTEGEIEKALQDEGDAGRIRAMFQDRKETLPKEALFSDHKKDLARELIRNRRSNETKEILKKIQKEVVAALERKSPRRQSRDLLRVEKKYGLSVVKEAAINRYDGLPRDGSGFTLSENQKTSIFKKGLAQRETYVFDNASHVVVARVFPAKKRDAKSSRENLEQEVRELERIFSGKLAEQVVSRLQEAGSVKVNSRILQYR